MRAFYATSKTGHVQLATSLLANFNTVTYACTSKSVNLAEFH